MGLPPETTDAPPLPYAVEVLAYGPGEGVGRPTKVYADARPRELMSDDEAALWRYVRWLEGQNAELKRKLETAWVAPPLEMMTENAQEKPPEKPPERPAERKAGRK